MIRSKKRLRLCCALLVVNLAFIWGNSLLPAEASRAFSDWVRSVLLALLPSDGSAGGGSGLLRKIAHFTEFAALGMCLRWMLGMLGKSGGLGLLWGGLAACVDEFIQMFVPGRGPGLLDVCIDTAGVAAGILLLTFGYFFIQRTRKIKQSGGKTK